MEASGVSPEEISAMLEAALPDIDMAEDEAEAVRLFARVQTQWNRGPAGELSALDYTAVREVAGIIGIELDNKLFRYVQVMETAVLKEARERGRRNSQPKRPLRR
jgi:hypothetical protein